MLNTHLLWGGHQLEQVPRFKARLFLSPYQVLLDGLYRFSRRPHIRGEGTSGHIFISEFDIDSVLARLNRKILHCACAILVVCARDLGFRGSLN